MTPPQAAQSSMGPPLTRGTTPAPVRNTGPFNCTFETNFCGWNQDNRDQFDWTRIKGSTSTNGTGPTGDHTQANHSKIYVFEIVAFKSHENYIPFSEFFLMFTFGYHLYYHLSSLLSCNIFYHLNGFLYRSFSFSLLLKDDKKERKVQEAKQDE